jgi:hypothetical protein
MKISLSLFAIAVWIAAIVGWIANIVVLYGASFDPLTGPVILRIVGIFVAPLGSILGLFF